MGCIFNLLIKKKTPLTIMGKVLDQVNADAFILIEIRG